MGAVDIGVGHNDDLVVAKLVDIDEAVALLVAPDAGTQSCDQRADLVVAEHLVLARALHVQHLAAERQHRLVLSRAALLGRAAGAIALDDQQL